jgi:hypothetical protein
MAEHSTEDRHAIRAALTQTAVTRIEQPRKIDAYERESRAIVQPGLARDEVIERILRRMALKLDAGSSSSELIFRIEHSEVHEALVVLMSNARVIAYTLCPL